jgi:hypothetical protein
VCGEAAAAQPRRYSSFMRRARKDPRPTLAAYGAPLVIIPKRDMDLEDALARALVVARRDPTLVLSVPVVLLDNAHTLDPRKLLRAARQHGVASELGMMLDLTARVGRRRAFARLARLLPRRTGRPVYYPRALGGRRGRALADLNTPPVVARWGFRMNETEADLRSFVEKHRG